MTPRFSARLVEGSGIDELPNDCDNLCSCLLSALKQHEANRHEHQRSIKSEGTRGFIGFDWSHAEKRHQAGLKNHDSPGVVFDRRWAIMLLNCVHGNLREEYARNGKTQHFEVLHSLMDVKSNDTARERAAARLGMTRAAMISAVSRMRRRRRRILRSLIAATVASPGFAKAELKYLMTLFPMLPPGAHSDPSSN